MGVDPLLRGKGIGAALMTRAVEVCDRHGHLAYLESTKPSNVPFYERFGFVRYGMIEVGGHPPVTAALTALPTLYSLPRDTIPAVATIAGVQGGTT